MKIAQVLYIGFTDMVPLQGSSSIPQDLANSCRERKLTRAGAVRVTVDLTPEDFQELSETAQAYDTTLVNLCRVSIRQTLDSINGKTA